MERLPGGGKSWFVRHRRGVSYQFVPCSREGWFVVGGCLTLNLLAVLLLLPEPTLLRWVVWATVEVTVTVLLIVIAFRTSAPGWRDQ